MAAPSDRSHLRISPVADGVHVRLVNCDQLDENTVPPCRQQLLALTATLGAARLVLDLQDVRFLTSVALDLFVLLHRKVRDGGGSLTICGLVPAVREVFEVTQLTRVLDIRPADEAGPPPA
jgi:anti-anti-sigma factor